MIIFNYKVNGRLVYLTIWMWILVFLTGCNTETKTAPWDENEVSRLSEVGQNKTVPVVLIETE